MAVDSIQELGTFILDKFRHPNYDMRYLGASSDHTHLERDIMRTLNELSKSQKPELFNQLRGHILALQTVHYYSEQEVAEILDKIDKAEN